VKVLHVASEVAPFAQTGGLADVLAGLPQALAALGIEVATLAPLYRGTLARLAAAGVEVEDGPARTLAIGPHRVHVRLRLARVGAVTTGWVECPALYDRDGLYGPPGGDFGDNPLRFAALGRAAVELGAALLDGEPDVLHVHDWQGALAAVYARLAAPRRAIVATIHNLAFRGIFPKHLVPELGLPWEWFELHRLEFHDQLSLLKGGLAAADVVTTVSPSYAREILEPIGGVGLDGFLRADVRRLVGIVNGIDTGAWDPATDPALAAPYFAEAPDGKASCRAALLDELGWALPAAHPLLAVVSRLTDQKGVDLIAELVPSLAARGARLVVLGSGDRALEDRFRYLATAFSHHVRTIIGFDQALSRRIFAGADLFLMPSRFEPCGLGQLYAMRYGAIPIVRAVGGLRDTVEDPGDAWLARGEGTGIRFGEPTVAALGDALDRALHLVRDPDRLAAVRRGAMRRDSSWRPSAQRYLDLYRGLLR
jgi:starch synthase